MWRLALCGLPTIASMLACGRLGFDAGDSELPGQSVFASMDFIKTGVSTIDVQFCAVDQEATDLVVVLTYDDLGQPTPADIVALNESNAGISSWGASVVGGCSTYGNLDIGREQATVHVYSAMTSEIGETIVRHATTQMEPTWMDKTTTGGRRYWLHRPEDFYKVSAEPTPLLVFFHGWGHAGNVNVTSPEPDGYEYETLPMNSGFLERFNEEAGERNPMFAYLPFTVVVPHCTDGEDACWGWAEGPNIFVEMVSELAPTTDPQRVYVTGLSTGGEGAWRVAMTHSDLVAAALPLSPTFDALFANTNASGARGVPIWGFHSSVDDNGNTPPSNSDTLAELVNGTGGRANITKGPWTANGSGHAGWYEVYGGEHGGSNDGVSDVFEWLMLWTLDNPPQP